MQEDNLISRKLNSFETLKMQRGFLALVGLSALPLAEEPQDYDEYFNIGVADYFLNCFRITLALTVAQRSDQFRSLTTAQVGGFTKKLKARLFPSDSPTTRRNLLLMHLAQSLDAALTEAPSKIFSGEPMTEALNTDDHENYFKKVSTITENDITILRIRKLSLESAPLDHFMKMLRDFGASFSFWREWYQGFLDGKPMDWELQRRVALIPDEDWEQGPEHIAEKIEEIRAEYLAEKVPLAEKVELNETTGKFHVVPIPLQNQPLIGATLAQVSDALDDALENPANGLNDRSRETRVIRRTVERYGNDPQRIEMDFTTVHAGLTRQIARDELPASEENTALIEALREGAQSIRATHPEVAANREILNQQAFAELSDEQKQVLSDAQPILEDISEGALKEDFAEDIPFLLEEKFLAPVAPELGVPERNPVLAGYAEAQRTISRAAKIMIFLKKYPDLVKAIEENSAYKTASIVGRLGGLIAIGLALFQ